MSVHDLPDTPKMREKMATQGAENMRLMGLSGPEVQPWEDGFRSKDQAEHAFEWWYFDMQLDDGSTLVATFNTKPATAPDGPLDPSVLIIYRDADGNHQRETVPAPVSAFSSASDHCDVTVGNSQVTGDLATYTLHVEGTHVSADLVLTRATPSWRPGAGVTWFDHAKKHFLAWVVPVPYGTVAGSVTVDGVARQVTGTGYHDHNWGNRQMNSMLHHWFWGRAHIGDYTMVYACLTSKHLPVIGQMNLPTVMLATSDRILTDDMLPLRLATGDEVPGPAPDHQPYPTTLDWTWNTDQGSFSLAVRNPRLIESLDMASPRGGWLHHLLHAHEHPWYYDFTADATLAIDLAGVKDTVTGHTLYEKMMLR